MKIVAVFLLFVMCFFLNACGLSNVNTTDPIDALVTENQSATESVFEGEITLDFSFGTRTGNYSGTINEKGVPNGYGIFTAYNTEGLKWTYEGDWENGHWEGTGKSTWSNGLKYVGQYSNDMQIGKGTYIFNDGSSFEGIFSEGDNADGVYTDIGGTKYYAHMVNGNLETAGIWRTGNFDSEIDAFQGEWKKIGSNYGSLVISGESINFISYMNIGSKHYVDVTTFYFGKNNDGNLIVVNTAGSPRYEISLEDDGTLKITGDSKNESYNKVSDSIEIPKETYEPKIGMTESEIYGSTWGAPNKKNKTTTAGGTTEQWVYDDGYIYFENGIVIAIQEI